MVFDEAAHRLANEQAARISAEIIEELTAKKGFRPLVAVLKKAEQQAALALLALADAHAEEPKVIRSLQNEVVRFTSLIAWTRDLVGEGIAASFDLEEAASGYMDLMDIDPDARRELETDFNMPQQRMNDA